MLHEFDDPKGLLRALLATDGVANDLDPARLREFTGWMIDTFGNLPARRWRQDLRRQLRNWPNPGANDDRTLALMWTTKEENE